MISERVTCRVLTTPVNHKGWARFPELHRETGPLPMRLWDRAGIIRAGARQPLAGCRFVSNGRRLVAQCACFNCSCGKQSRSEVIPLLSFHMQTNGGCADAHAVDLIENRIQHNRPRKVVSVRRGGKEDEGLADEG